MLNNRIPNLLILAVFLSSCWPRAVDNDYSKFKAWGYKPIYATDHEAKKIEYSPIPRDTVQNAGNIYAYQNYIFQIEPGFGIHVIDNSVPASAKRVGFLTVGGCSEMSIKAGMIYINSYDDLVVLKFSGSAIQEYSRLNNVFKDYRYGSPISQPPGKGYYECPNNANDSLVIGWKQDSVYMRCYKN